MFHKQEAGYNQQKTDLEIVKAIFSLLGKRKKQNEKKPQRKTTRRSLRRQNLSLKIELEITALAAVLNNEDIITKIEQLIAAGKINEEIAVGFKIRLLFFHYNRFKKMMDEKRYISYQAEMDEYQDDITRLFIDILFNLDDCSEELANFLFSRLADFQRFFTKLFPIKLEENVSARGKKFAQEINSSCIRINQPIVIDTKLRLDPYYPAEFFESPRKREARLAEQKRLLDEEAKMAQESNWLSWLINRFINFFEWIGEKLGINKKPELPKPNVSFEQSDVNVQKNSVNRLSLELPKPNVSFEQSHVSVQKELANYSLSVNKNRLNNRRYSSSNFSPRRAAVNPIVTIVSALPLPSPSPSSSSSDSILSSPSPPSSSSDCVALTVSQSYDDGLSLNRNSPNRSSPRR